MLFLAAAGAAALLVSLPLLPPYYLITLCYALVLSIACLGLNLLFGTTGLLSLGHAAYFGVGAYTGGFLYAFTPLASLELYLVAGVLAALALATAFGFLCVRATRMHFTILTLALAQVVHALFIGVAGGLHGELSRQVTPEHLDWLFSAQLVVATVLGGTRHFAGPVLGAFAYVALEDLALRSVGSRALLSGLVLVAVVFAFPGGLAGSPALLRARLRRAGERRTAG